MSKFGEQFLHKKDQKLHTSKSVELEIERKKMRGEEVSQKPAEKISDWLKVIERTHTGHGEDPEVMERIRNYYHKENVIKSEDIPESYYENQKRLAHEQGHGDIEITREMKGRLTEVIIKDQQTTLDNWVNYFTSPDADAYPMWAKYWAFTSMLKLSTFDKEKHAFAKRDKNTVAPFPDLNREALAYVVDTIVKKANNEKIEAVDNNPELKQLLDGASFSKLYAYAIEKVTSTEKNELENTKGEWKKYKQDSDHMPLVESIQGYGTGWCTAGESTARIQLQDGDFYVYYSYDKQGKPTIPRIAIRMQDDNIGEVRGIAPDQNLDPYIGDIVKAKLAEFPDGQAYEKKSADMKLLTEIDNKTKQNQQLTKSELLFLYEINSIIEGFGYQRDPRIEEVRKQRNSEEDMLVIFECTRDQIAHNPQEINKNTKAYVGSLQKDIFTKIQEYNIEYVYTSFPEGKIQKYNIEIGGKTKTQLEKDLEAKNIYISSWANDLLNSKDFTTLEKTEKENLIRLTVKDLGFSGSVTTDQIYKRAQEVGLELCPVETGPNFRLQYSGTEWLLIGMKQISGRVGRPGVFGLDRRGGGGRLGLGAGGAGPGGGWRPEDRFVFCLRELEK